MYRPTWKADRYAASFCLTRVTIVIALTGIRKYITLQIKLWHRVYFQSHPSAMWTELILESLVNPCASPLDRCHYNLRKYSFSMRITNVWNSLPFSIVTAPSVNSFENRLDKHWASQELTYDWEAELSGTGSRSRVEFWVLRVLPLYLHNNDMGIEALRLRP